jgi:hypothetical protein
MTLANPSLPMKPDVPSQKISLGKKGLTITKAHS